MIHDISCIIPIKNEEELPYLVSLLDDLCRQTEKYRLEIIIVVSDGVKKVIEQTYRLKDRFEYVPPIVVRDLETKYVATSRNWGATSSTGDILVFFDCDNSLEDTTVADLAYPIINTECVMTYSPSKYDEGEYRTLAQYKTTKEYKLIKYNNFLLRFDIMPGIPFAIHKEVFRQMGGLKAKNPMFNLCSKLLLKYPGGINKVDTTVLVSPRHILERAKKKSK